MSCGGVEAFPAVPLFFCLAVFAIFVWGILLPLEIMIALRQR
jgi:hypothetical protein